MPSGNCSIDYDGVVSRSYEPGRQISPPARATWRLAVAPYLRGVRNVVDVGAGTGRFARLFADADAGFVVAVEPSAGMRQAGRDAARDQSVRWLAGTAESLPLASGSANLVWTAFTAHYLDLLSAGREFRRVLRDDGCLLVWHAFPDVFDELEWYRWFPSARVIDENRTPTFDQVAASFDAGGLNLIDRTTHLMQIADDMHGLANRLAHRAISRFS